MIDLKSKTKKILLSTLVASSLVTSAFATTPFIDGNFSTANLNGLTMYSVFYDSDDAYEWVSMTSTFTDSNISHTLGSDTFLNDYSISSGMLSIFDDGEDNLVKITDSNSSVLTICWENSTNIDNCTIGDQYYFSNQTEAETFVTAQNDYIAANSIDVTLDGQITFVDENNDTIAMPTDAGIRITSNVDMDNDNWGRFEAPIDSNGSFSITRSLLENTYDENNTFQVVVFKNHINTSEFNWDCGEDTYKYLSNPSGGNVDFESWSNIVVTPTDFQDRSSESCGDSYSASSVIEEITVIETELANATDMPEDLRTTIENLLAEAYVILAVEPLDETALTNKLAEIYAIVDTIGDKDAYLYGTDASKISGTVTLPTDTNLTSPESCFDTTTYMPLPTCNAIFVDLMAKDGEWLGSTMVDSDGSYNLYFRELTTSTIDAILQVHIHLDGVEEHYFRDFGTDNAINGDEADSFKSDMEIEWVEDSTGMWNPNVNHLTISTATTTLDLDVSDMDADKYVLEGTVVVPADFTPGEIWGDNAEWLGFQMVNLTAINITTGEHYWTEIGRTATDDANTTYPFSFKLPKSEGNYTIRIEKMSDKDGAFEWVEMYLNDGGDNTFGTNSDADTLVSNTGIMWDTAKDSSDNVLVDSNGHEIWIPDTTKTGYFTVNADVASIAIDIANYGNNFYKIAGTITPPSDFNTTSFNDNINVDILDAKTGWWIGGAPVMCDDSGACTYSVVLGDSFNDYDGSGNGGYIIQMHQNHWDNDNWANSWWKNYYFDLGTDNAVGGSNTEEDSIKDEMDVRWTESAELDSNSYPYWKPDVNHFEIASGTDAADVTDVNISFGDYTAPTTYTISGVITDIPDDAQWANVHMYDPINYIGNGAEINSDGTFEIQNVKGSDTNGDVSKYILEVHYDTPDRHYHYIITDADGDGEFSLDADIIDGMDVKWIPYDSDGLSLETNTSSSTFNWETVSYWAPQEKMLIVDDADIIVASVGIPTINYFNLATTINGLANNTNVSFNLFVPNEPIGRWESNSSASDGTVTSAILKNLKARDDYQLQIWVDGLGEFWYDKNITRSPQGLNSDVYWVGKQDDTICDDWKNEIWSCNWSNPVEWGVNIEGISITADEALDLTVPNDRATITAILEMGANDANKTFDVNMWQHGGNNYAWESFEANATGDVTVSLSVKQGLDYRMEVYNPQNWEGFVVDLGSNAQDSGDESLITNQNSWATDGAWGPKTTTLIDLEDANLTDGVLDLGTLTPPTLKSVTFTVANLEDDGNNITEDIWIGLENNTTHEWYGNGNADWADWTNPTYSNEVTVKVPTSTGDEAYIVHIYPMSHKGGMVDDDNAVGGTLGTSIDFTSGSTATTWDSANADTIAIADNTAIALTLKPMDTYVSISGTVTLSGIVSESGWICAWNETADNDGQCSEVNSDGTYTIKGLSPSNNGDAYLVEYWANSGETFRTLQAWADIANDLIVDISFVAAAADLVTISGTVTDTDDAIVEIVLLEVATDSSWKVMDAIGIEDSWDGTSMSFEFTDLPPALSGFHYEIAVASTVVTGTGVATYTMTNSTGLDSAATGVTLDADDATVTITITQ